MAHDRITPTIRLQYAMVVLFLSWSVVIAIALAQPSSRLEIVLSEQQTFSVYWQEKTLFQHVEFIEISDPSQQQQIRLTVVDFMEDPHFVDSYAQMQTFFQQQEQLSQFLKQHPSVLLSSPTSAESYLIDIVKRRTLKDLPVVFWFQLSVSSLGFLLGCWIWALRPQEMATRVFALLNTMYPVFAFPAAIYSTRDLALSGDLFRVLVSINTGGALLYGCALISLFLVYPRQLVKTYWLGAIFVFFFIWWLLDTFFLLPEPSMGGDLPVTLQMITAIICMGLQWRANRHDPHVRVALRWFAAWILVSCGLFVFLLQSSQLLQIDLNLSQGYAFGFFLLATLGIAIGLRRYQLFNLDRWAFSILYWLAGAILLVIIDAVLVMVLSPLVSLSLAVLICGLLWLPIRAWLQSLLFKRKHLTDSELFERVLQISFAVNEVEREQQWRLFLQDVFQPLKIEEYNGIFDRHSVIDENGLILDIPQVVGFTGLRLSYPHQGRGLFNPYDQQLVNNVLQLIAHATQSRTAYDRGVATERQRIARDLHDDLGAKLLSGLYQKDIEQAKKSIREAISEMRTIIKGLVGTGVELTTILDELEIETVYRLDQCGITLFWQAELNHQVNHLSYTQYKNYVSIVREVISNIMKYAQAQQVNVSIRIENGILMTKICDDGTGIQEDDVKHYGYGMQNMQQRANELQGVFDYDRSQDTGCVVQLSFPI